jgi:FkbM family methyltransferase
MTPTSMLRRHIARFVPKGVKTTLRKLQKASQDLREAWKERTFRPYIISKEVEDVTFDFFIGDPTAKEWYEKGSSAWTEELRFMRENMIDAGDIIFDCGGHHGYCAILFSQWVGEKGKVVAFEPNPRNVAILERNIGLNRLRNVLVEEKAVGPADVDATVTNASDTVVKPKISTNRLDEWLQNKRRSVRDGIEVKMVTLDSYAKLNNLYPTMLKIDVEGYEVEVLKGAQTLLQRTPKLAIEIHSPETMALYDSSVRELFALIDFKRYKSWIQWEWDQPPVVFDPESPLPSQYGHLFLVLR